MSESLTKLNSGTSNIVMSEMLVLPYSGFLYNSFDTLFISFYGLMNEQPLRILNVDCAFKLHLK